MKQYSVSQIGTFHTNHNEDFLNIDEIGDDKLLIAVMDGCSMGTESYFASCLIGKLLRKIAKELHFKDFIESKSKSLEYYLKEITKQLFEELKDLKHKLFLEREELLSTLLLGIVDYQKKMAEVLVLGDGLVCCNGTNSEYEQNDKPDYLGYHLEEDFETWFVAQTQRLSLHNIQDISLATDGIFSFKKFDTKIYPAISEMGLVQFLLLDSEGQNQKNMLKQKLFKIEEMYGLKPSDDLSIIRVLLT